MTPQMIQTATQIINIEYPGWEKNRGRIETDNDVKLFAQYIFHQYPIFAGVANDLEDFIAQRFNIVINHNVNAVISQNHVPWFSDFKQNNQMTFWNAYSSYAGAKGLNVAKIDRETDRIMDCLPHPTGDPFAYRGIVLGYVQSGKTSNYLGLINKAADAGYKLIIVLSGMYNDLRKQTNERIDEGFLGRYTGIDGNRATLWQNGNIVNVSQFRGNAAVAVNNLTSSDINGDVNANANNTYNPNVLTVAVCKKNTSTLDALLRMLDTGERENGYPKINIPILVIDDEADSATIDSNYDRTLTRKDLITATAINKKIRCLLTMFRMSAYVGYTATPYANFLIDRMIISRQHHKVRNIRYIVGEGLFPKDFAICLEPDSKYIGSESLFGENPLPIIRNYDEQVVNAALSSQNRIISLPDILKESIHSFIIATAIRRLRGQRETHSSMLIHTCYQIERMNSITELVNEYINNIRDAYNIAVGNNEYDNILNRLFINDFQQTAQDFSPTHIERYGSFDEINYPWQNIKNEIRIVLNKIRVIGINSDNNAPLAGRLDYRQYENRQNVAENGDYVIAVGGNCLSRGLTLEGLITSFFYRNTSNYDTLMQMGRWFGYRPGYYDLCRVYLSQNIQNRFAAITVADLDLREQIQKLIGMNNVTPESVVFSIQIASGMRVTAQRRQGNGIIGLPANLEGLKQTKCLPISQVHRQKMYEVVNSLFENIVGPDERRLQENRNHIWWTNKQAPCVVDFIRNFNTILEQAACLQPNLVGLAEFIEAEQANGHLTNWTIVLINNTTHQYGQFTMPSANANPINMVLRTKPDLDTNPYVFTRNRGITQGGDESLDFSDAELQTMFPNGNYTDEMCRRHRPNDRGLLLIYPIIIAENNEIVLNDYSRYPLFGYAVSSPSEIIPNGGLIIYN